jgi:hypothetical protein
MIATGLVALLSIASAVVAQSTAAAGSPPNIPACLLTCTQKSCPTSDLTCICITHLTDITSCALASCSQADLALASTLAADQCGTRPNFQKLTYS